MIVVDASAVIARLIGRPHDPSLNTRLAREAEFCAPHLLDLEVLQVLRRLVTRALMTEDRANDARHDLADLTIRRFPHVPLRERIWDLRANITAYDAAYVALAELLDVPLITCDARLAHSIGHHARIELFGPD